MLRNEPRRFRALRAPATLATGGLVLAAVLVAGWAGGAVATGGRPAAVALGVAVAVLVLPLAHPVVTPRLRRGVLATEVPVVLLLLSTLVWRQRSAQGLLADPLDSAGKLRLAFVALSAVLGAIAFLSPAPSHAGSHARLTTRPARLYAVYILVVFAGAVLSVHPPLTAYRGVELATALIVLLGARRVLGDEAGPRVEAVLYWFVVAMVASVWLGVALFPDSAIGTIGRTSAPIRWNVHGVYPSISENSVGLFGVVLAIWTLARLQETRPTGRSRTLAYVLIGVGAVTLLAAQYRTGYVILALTLAVMLVLRRRWGLATLLGLVGALIVLWRPEVIQTLVPFLLRGETTTEARTLDSRVEYWSAALEVWRHSPLIGRGLLTGTRFEALGRLGLEFTSTIHGTWIEALVGTGLIGVSVLAASFLTTVRRALIAARRGAWTVPLLLLTVLGVRSITGQSIESFNWPLLLFLWIALSLPDRWPAAEAAAPGTVGGDLELDVRQA
jgi:O-Antigen ligase